MRTQSGVTTFIVISFITRRNGGIILIVFLLYIRRLLGFSQIFLCAAYSVLVKYSYVMQVFAVIQLCPTGSNY